MEAFLVEVGKSLSNRWFFLSLFVGCVFAVLSAMGNIGFYDESLSYALPSLSMIDPEVSSISLFRFLLFTDYLQYATELFYALLPLLAAMPYSWSLAQERRIGYFQTISIRVRPQVYLCFKGAAAFVSGALAVSLPLLVNLVIEACFIPAYPPSPTSAFFTGMYGSMLWSSLFYTDPASYCVLFIALHAGFSGLWATFVLMLGLFVDDGTRLIAGSFVFLYLFQAFEYQIAAAVTGTGTDYLDFSPLTFLRGTAIGGNTSEWSFVPWVVGLIVIIVAFIVHQRNKDVL